MCIANLSTAFFQHVDAASCGIGCNYVVINILLDVVINTKDIVINICFNIIFRTLACTSRLKMNISALYRKG